jgi:hypothetical protein
MINSTIKTIIFILCTIIVTTALAEHNKIFRPNKKVKISYTGSYALLIGESDYNTNAWQDLNSIPAELQQVEDLLKSQGFQVQTELNLNAINLKQTINNFINQYGNQKNNRLLFFYSGHGDTINGKGYLVPIDAPNPDLDQTGFLQKALAMDKIVDLARDFYAKHALFIFDSCFSGAIFKFRKPKIPRQIYQAATLPVRQFITAGRANETVPAKSIFTPAFIKALKFAKADMNKDGYITGQELGLYLWNKVPQYSRQTPQYGKINDYELSQGDFIFKVSSKPSLKIQYLYRHQGEYSFSPLTNNQTLYSGDFYKIVFTPLQNGYVYIFQQGSSGKIYKLFPNDNFPLIANKTYYIPAKNQAFYLDNQTGQEKIYIIATNKRNIQLEQEYEQTKIKYRDPGGISNDPQLLEQRLEKCQNCISQLTFWHQ